MNPISLRANLAAFSDHWSPKIAGNVGMNSFSALLVLFAMLFTNACNPKQGATRSKVAHHGDTQRISVGMPLEEALAILKSHHAKETGIQVVASDPNDHLRFFHLPNGRTLKLVSNADSHSQQTIKRISISTYMPKSWTSKQDPERSRFVESFKQLHHYDMGDQSAD